jgi:UDP-GlcNAc:undecaprenyl-phosphate GlcNAc-1-phosphate transferase
MLSRLVEIPAYVAYGFAFIISVLATLVATPLATRWAVRLGLVDRPGPSRGHTTATPILGGAALACGVAIIGALVLGLTAQVATLLLCAGAIAVLGLIDDLRGLQPVTKLAVEAGAGAGLFLTGSGAELFGIPGLDLPLTMLWVVALTNALNLLDNMDGLAPGVAAMSALGFFAISAFEGHILVAILAVALAGACLGFLLHNFPPARVFLGDAGSLLVGFLLAALGLNLDLVGQEGLVRVTIPILVLAVPLFDTTLVLVARIREDRPVFLGGTDHASHRLAARGMPHARVALLAIGIQAACSALAFALNVATDIVVMIGAAFALLVAGVALLATLRLEAPTKANPDPGILGGGQRSPRDAV